MNFTNDYERDYKIIEDFLNLLNRCEEQHCRSFDIQKKLEQEQNDLMHDIELCDDEFGNSIYSKERLKEILKERRKIKNCREYYFPIKQLSKEMPILKRLLRKVCDEMIQVKHQQENRVYKPRVRMDMLI